MRSARGEDDAFLLEDGVEQLLDRALDLARVGEVHLRVELGDQASLDARPQVLADVARRLASEGVAGERARLVTVRPGVLRPVPVDPRFALAGTFSSSLSPVASQPATVAVLVSSVRGRYSASRRLRDRDGRTSSDLDDLSAVTPFAPRGTRNPLP